MESSAAKEFCLNEAIEKTPIDSAGGLEPVLSSFTNVIQSAIEKTDHEQVSFVGVGIGTPGPFDYANGTSLMQHKFQSIYGIRLKDELQKRVPTLKEKPILFGCDANVFTLGEAWQGAGKGYSRIAGVNIGTGLGYGLIENCRIVDNGKGGPARTIFQMPCRDSNLEEFVSKRAILTMYKKKSSLCSEKELDVKEVARLCTK